MTIKTKLRALKEELGTFAFWKAIRCEFLITMIYVFIGCGSLTHIRTPAQDTYLKVALTFGLAEATLVQCVGHISGAHLNPAITIAMLVTGKVSVARAVSYMLAQCVGAIAGAGILFGTTPAEFHGSLGVTYIKEGVLPGQAFAVEFMVTFVMVFTYFANLEPCRVDMGSRSLSIGLSVCLGHLFAVYWTGPMIGGVIGGFTYEYTQCTSDDIQRFKYSFRRKKNDVTVNAMGRADSPSGCTELSIAPSISMTDDLRI